MKKKTRTQFLLSPLHLFGLVNLIILSSIFFTPNLQVLSQRAWYISSSDFQVIALGLLGTFGGLITGNFFLRSKFCSNNNFSPILNEKRALIIEKFGKITFFLAISGYGIWIATAFNGWINFQNLSHVETIPGLTTLTQFMPISLASFFFLFRNNFSSPIIKKAIWAGIVLSIVRSFINHERLAFLECVVPLIIVYFITERRVYKVRLYRFYIGGLCGIYFLFSLSEYFRSWQYYRYVIDESFLSFSFFRLVNYYSTALNNGVVYLDLHDQISSLPVYSLNFVWNFPIFGPYLENRLDTVNYKLSWSQVLKSTMGTDEFNNINPYFILVAEFGKIGAVVVFGLLGFLMNRVYQKISGERSCTIPIYSCLVVGILEFPRIFWFGSGRALPTLLASVYLYKKLKYDPEDFNQKNLEVFR